MIKRYSMNQQPHRVYAMTDTDSIIRGNYSCYRQVRSCDAPIIFRWLNEEMFLFYRPYFSYICPTIDKIARHIEMVERIEPQVEIEYFILEPIDDAPVGLVSLQSIDHINKKAELCLFLRKAPAFRMELEAIWMAVMFAFQVLELEKLYFYVSEKNNDFLNILTKRGWAPEALLVKELRMLDGTRLDVFRFILFPEDLSTSFWKLIQKAIKQSHDLWQTRRLDR